MSVEKLSNSDIAAYAANEGLDYAITVIDSNHFEDQNLAILWKKAQDILSQIEEILGLEDIVDVDDEDFDTVDDYGNDIAEDNESLGGFESGYNGDEGQFGVGA